MGKDKRKIQTAQTGLSGVGLYFIFSVILQKKEVIIWHEKK